MTERDYMKLGTVTVSLLIALSLIRPARVIGQTTVGDPRSPGDLPAAIADARHRGATDITITPGEYDLPPQKQGDTIVLDHWAGETIHAVGVTLVFEDLAHRPLSFRHCNNLKWEGGTLRFAKPAFTQGRIRAIGSDGTGNYCDWEIDRGYPIGVDPLKLCFNTVDPATRVLKVGTGDWTPPAAEVLGAGEVPHAPAAERIAGLRGRRLARHPRPRRKQHRRPGRLRTLHAP